MWKFWQLFLNAMTNVTVFLFFSAEWKIFASHLGVNNDSYLAIIGSASSLCNGICRIFWGLFYDWTGSFAISMGTMCIIMSIFIATLTLCSASPDIMIFIWTCVLFACIGGNYTFFPTCITETFGVKYNGVIIGLLLLAEIPSSLLFTFLCDNIQKIFGGWDNLIWAVTGFSLASCLLSITFNPKIDHSKYMEWHKQNEIESLHEIEAKERETKLIEQKKEIERLNSIQSNNSKRIKNKNKNKNKHYRHHTTGTGNSYHLQAHGDNAGQGLIDSDNLDQIELRYVHFN